MNADIWKDPEIVAFSHAYNLPPIDCDLDFSLISKNMSFEEEIRLGFKLAAMDDKTLKEYLSSEIKLRALANKWPPIGIDFSFLLHPPFVRN